MTFKYESLILPQNCNWNEYLQSNLSEEMQTILDTSKDLPSIADFMKSQMTDNEFAKYCLIVELNTTEQELYPIDFTKLFKELGYQQKPKAVAFLKSLCTENKDYIQLFRQEVIQQTQAKTSPNPSHEFKLTIEAAQRFAMQSHKPNSIIFCDLFIKIVKALSMYQVLTLAFNQIKRDVQQREEIQLLERQMHHKNILQTLTVGDKMVYIAWIGENLYKIGFTNDHENRFRNHKSCFPNFLLRHVLKHENYIELEKWFKTDDMAVSRLENYVDKKGETRVEIFKTDDQWTEQSMIKLLERGIKYLPSNTVNEQEVKYERNRTQQLFDFEQNSANQNFELQKMRETYEFEKSKLQMQMQIRLKELEIESKKIDANFSVQKSSDKDTTNKDLISNNEDKVILDQQPDFVYEHSPELEMNSNKNSKSKKACKMVKISQTRPTRLEKLVADHATKPFESNNRTYTNSTLDTVVIKLQKHKNIAGINIKTLNEIADTGFLCQRLKQIYNSEFSTTNFQEFLSTRNLFNTKSVAIFIKFAQLTEKHKNIHKFDMTWTELSKWLTNNKLDDDLNVYKTAHGVEWGTK